MMPLHSAFRRTVRRYVPQLSPDDLDRYESLVSLINHLNVERGSLKPSTSTKKGAKKGKRSPSAVEAISPASHLHDPDLLLRDEMKDILANYENLYRKSRELWIARRQLAVQYGNFLQIPYTWRGLWLFLSANAKYRWVQFRTSYALSSNRWFKYPWQNLTVAESIAILLLFALLAVSTWFVLAKLLTVQ